MNTKVVVVWAFIIAIFALLGIYGYVNRDLLKNVEQEDFQPIVDAENKHECVATLDRGKITYTFANNDSNQITNLYIEYKNTLNVENSDTISDYTNAANLSNMSVKGIDALIDGGISNFSLKLFINQDEYDADALSSQQLALDQLKIHITKEKDYESYKALLTASYDNIECN